MSMETTNVHFQSNRRYKMIAAKQVQIPLFRGIGGQRGQRFNALGKVNQKTAMLFLLENIVLAAKRVLTFWKLTRQKLQMLFKGGKDFKAAAKSL